MKVNVTVRFKIALTIIVTGLLTALGVIATLVVAFQRLQHETEFDRANMFLNRVVATHDNLLELHSRYPADLNNLLRNLLLFEADTQLYLLDTQGKVLSSTGNAALPVDFRVALGPVKDAAMGSQPGSRMPYVMGDDPERMDGNAVIAARALRPAVIRNTDNVEGYLYVVCHKPGLPQGGLDVFRSAFAGPALVGVAAVVALTTLLAAWIVAAVTRPLRRISAEVARATHEGLNASNASEAERMFGSAPSTARPPDKLDEFGQLREGFRMLMATCIQQWQSLRQLDHFRREGVSNLSHDLRSPLTATVACLETLEQRWAKEAHSNDDDLRLIEMALRNTRNAAQLVKSLGDLAQLDEPEFKLHTEVLDISEMLDDIALRFGDRATQKGITLLHAHDEAAAPAFAAVDIELLERAIANLLENALKFTSAGGSITLAVTHEATAPHLTLSVTDTGAGIPEKDLPHLFDRLYQARDSVAPASSAEGKGLGLAIVKRIAELHQGTVAVQSVVGTGTRVVVRLKAMSGLALV